MAMVNHPLSDPDIEVTAQHTEQALAAGDAQVDVREAYEREAGHIEGTRHIELERLSGQAATIDKDRPVIFHCRAGVRSLMAAQAFRRAGYEAYSMEGGIKAWDEAGLPMDGVVADH
jgi:rhodanese-related sulfurtransferase